MKLSRALRLPGAARVALTGAGGKTTALFQAARELSLDQGGQPRTVLVSATTHLGKDQVRFADQHRILTSEADVESLSEQVPPGIVLCTGGPGREDRMLGLEMPILATLHQLAESLDAPLLVEADGSRRLPLKAPGEHEPVIPAFTSTLVVVAGLSGLGQPLDESQVHRSQRFADLSGLSTGDPVTPEALVRVLLHPSGGLKAAPPAARKVALLNQADTDSLQSVAKRMAASLLEGFDSVLIAALEPETSAGGVFAVHERIAGIVLAAGASQRFGSPKQLLSWGQETFVHRVARTALEAGLSPVVVVTGAYASEVAEAVRDLPVEVVDNPDWEAGQSASVITGLRRLPRETGGAVFLLADQPQAPEPLIRQLYALHAGSLAPIVAPQADGQRANPVLFDRDTFPDLLQLQGDTGGRALFSRFRPIWLPWHDPNLLLDVDTQGDYRRLMEIQP